VIEMEEEVDVAAVQETVMHEGVWLRPFRNLIYTMPPYVTDADDVNRITTAMLAAARTSG
jgi:adenosylmethionine---8-amino-7-oxononanoate aminotransferase